MYEYNSPQTEAICGLWIDLVDLFSDSDNILSNVI
jgi:hypothetical protein